MVKPGKCIMWQAAHSIVGQVLLLETTFWQWLEVSLPCTLHPQAPDWSFQAVPRPCSLPPQKGYSIYLKVSYNHRVLSIPELLSCFLCNTMYRFLAPWSPYLRATYSVSVPVLVHKAWGRAQAGLTNAGFHGVTTCTDENPKLLGTQPENPGVGFCWFSAAWYYWCTSQSGVLLCFGLLLFFSPSRALFTLPSWNYIMKFQNENFHLC